MPSGDREAPVCVRFLRQMMDGRGILQKALADRLGVTQGFISKVLTGTQPLPLDDTAAWAEALELSADQAALLNRYAIRSYGPACAVELLDAIDTATARQDALEREVAALTTAIDATKRYAEALERELAAFRAERDAAAERRRSV